MKRILVIAVIAAALLGAGLPLAAETGVGYSSVFGIDNTAGAPEPVSCGAENPHTSSNGDLLRGQVHAHYKNDMPIKLSPDSDAYSVASKYEDLGYKFVCITEHNVITPAQQFPDAFGAPNCEEVTTSFAPHVLALGLDATSPAIDTSIGNMDQFLGWLSPALRQLYRNTVLHWGVIARMIGDVHQRGGLAIIAHPNMSGLNPDLKNLGYYADNGFSGPELRALKRLGSRSDGASVVPDGLNIYNAPISRTYASGLGGDSLDIWDYAVENENWHLWGFTEDDYAPGVYKAKDCAGRTWIAVPAPAGNTSWTDIRGKIVTGNFYAYWMEGDPWPSSKTPPQVTVSVTTGEGGRPKIGVTLSGIEPEPPNSTHSLDFIGAKHWDWGIRTRRWTGYIPQDGTYEYQCNGREKFIRVALSLKYDFGTLRITSQPILVYKTGNPYTQQALASSSAMSSSSSSGLLLRYLEPSEKPAAPPAGYVGNAFDVTTDDGLVPPGATLQLSYEGEDTCAIGGTQYLAIYRYDTGSSAWAKVGGTVDPGTATIEAPIDTLGFYTISADLPPDTTVPEVFIDNPPSGGIVNMDTTVRATVNDDLGAWRVQFYLNGHLLREDADALDFWAADIPIANYCEGDWTLKTVAEDLAGNQGTAEIPIYIHSSTPPPTVTIASPTSMANLSGTVTATGTCGDDVAVALVTLKMGETVIGFGEVNGSDWTCDIDTTYLVDGARTLTATVEDHPGNSATASVLVNVANGGAVAIGDLKSRGDGETAKFSNAIVVAGTDLVSGGFYAENANRISGIRVLTDRTVNAGDIVSVSGAMTSVGAEKAVQAYDVQVLSTGNTLPDPLGMSGRGLLGFGLDSIGKIVRAYGRVTGTDTSNPAKWFTISDGSPMDIKCAVPSGVAAPTTGFYQVTGVCSVDPDSGGAQILVGDSAGVYPLQ